VQSQKKTKKNIGTLYLILGMWSGIVGTRLSIVIRVELVQPGAFLGRDQIYNVVVTAHAFVMIFFFLFYSYTYFGVFGNWLVPLILGSPDMAFPRLNKYKILIPAPCSYSSSYKIGSWKNGAGTGWNSVSTLKRKRFSQRGSCGFLLFLVFILAGVSSLLGAVNFITTIVNLRALGLYFGSNTYVPLSCFDYCYSTSSFFTGPGGSYYYTPYWS